MTITALRYAVEYPLGTVVYEPEQRHLPPDLDPKLQREVLRQTPHNQILVVLVYYGWPGLALLMTVFYGVIGVALLSSIRLAMKLRTAEAIVLVAALAGCIVAYGCHSLFHNAGPFVGDWHHWIVIGLVFSAHAVLKRSDRKLTCPDQVEGSLICPPARGSAGEIAEKKSRGLRCRTRLRRPALGRDVRGSRVQGIWRGLRPE